jgi:hypothetical protein
MAFAAMAVGLPVSSGISGEDPELAAALDMDQFDPDLEDLREEFRPRLKARFDGWCKVAARIEGGSAIMIKAYAKVVELMPFLRASDVVEEMLTWSVLFETAVP